MGRRELSIRDKWQDRAAQRGGNAEDEFYEAMTHHLGSSVACVDKKPDDLAKIYEESRGIRPDFAIRERGRTVYVEVKRQQAAGNAHERACKYWTPGILDSMRRQGGWRSHSVVPCWWVFTGGLTRDARYVAEISHWFGDHEGHVLLWQDIYDHKSLVRHFDLHILPLLKCGP